MFIAQFGAGANRKVWPSRRVAHLGRHEPPNPGASRVFMVPMHGSKAEGAFHEPRLVWSPAFRRLERLGPAEAGTPNKWRPTDRFRIPMHLEKTKGGSPGDAGISSARSHRKRRSTAAL